jgi:hypothetical protein
MVPDNLLSAVSKAHRYEPDLNPTYRTLPPHFRLFWSASPRGCWLSGVLIFSQCSHAYEII